MLGVLFVKTVALKNQVSDAPGWVITANVASAPASDIAPSAPIPTNQIVLSSNVKNVTG